VKAYRENVLRTIGAAPLFPLWKRDTTWLAHRFVERGYRAVVASVDTIQLDPSFVGRTYDEAFLDDLPDDVDPCGEHGAFHTFVLDGPPFPEPVPVEIGEPHGEGRMRYVRLRAAEPTAKGGSK
jgi:diphthamide synthase (EF-2-diphthine--ammonia ligase)